MRYINGWLDFSDLLIKVSTGQRVVRLGLLGHHLVGHLEWLDVRHVISVLFVDTKVDFFIRIS